MREGQMSWINMGALDHELFSLFRVTSVIPSCVVVVALTLAQQRAPLPRDG